MPAVDRWGADPLFGPFQRIQERFPSLPMVSYYDEPFHAFAGPNAWRQEWDLPTLGDLAGWDESHTLLDLGAGEGRLTNYLVSAGHPGTILGVDDNDFAAREFGARFARHSRVSFVTADLAQDELPRCDVAVMASVTVNSFRDHPSLDSFLTNVHRSLNPAGRLVMLAHREEAVANFQQLGRAMDAVDFIDPESGEHRLIWRGVDCVGQDLRQNYFIEYRGAEFPGVLGLLRERLWTSGEVAESAAKVGFHVNIEGVATVDEGAAEDWSCDALVLRPAS